MNVTQYLTGSELSFFFLKCLGFCVKVCFFGGWWFVGFLLVWFFFVCLVSVGFFLSCLQVLVKSLTSKFVVCC